MYRIQSSFDERIQGMTAFVFRSTRRITRYLRSLRSILDIAYGSMLFFPKYEEFTEEDTVNYENSDLDDFMSITIGVDAFCTRFRTMMTTIYVYNRSGMEWNCTSANFIVFHSITCY